MNDIEECHKSLLQMGFSCSNWFPCWSKFNAQGSIHKRLAEFIDVTVLLQSRINFPYILCNFLIHPSHNGCRSFTLTENPHLLIQVHDVVSPWIHSAFCTFLVPIRPLANNFCSVPLDAVLSAAGMDRYTIVGLPALHYSLVLLPEFSLSQYCHSCNSVCTPLLSPSLWPVYSSR